eukprot:GILJ01002649.1.p1 GENE.GILJ01002649.1~~GILJ01002649.1.p1  ORF type:complete len:311 (-),score=49.18 GILJ01002649.1:255-1070(-)
MVKQEACVSGVLSFLEHPDEAVALFAIQTLELLATPNPNKEILCGRPGLLAVVSRLSTSGPPRVKRIASQLVNNLESHKNRLASSPSEDDETASLETLAVSIKPPVATETMTFKVEGLDIGSREDLQKTLIGVIGVISVTVDLKLSRVVVNVKKLDNMKESVIAAINSTGKRAFPVEVDAYLNPFSLSGAFAESKGSSGYLDSAEPQYLDEEPGKAAANSWWGFALAKTDTDNSLDGKLKKLKKKDEVEQAQDEGKLSRIMKKLGRGLFII